MFEGTVEIIPLESCAEVVLGQDMSSGLPDSPELAPRAAFFSINFRVNIWLFYMRKWRTLP